MKFDPGFNIGQVVKNEEIIEVFKCGNMGGMRRSKKTNTLVLISDYTKGIYYDKWIGGILHYTGMGKKGDQDIDWAQNATLAKWAHNNVDVHLFEVLEAGNYTYCGRIELVSKPYTDTQPDVNGENRRVWIFPIRPVQANDVPKPLMFVFEDMRDYSKRGHNVDAEYVKLMSEMKKRKGKHLINLDRRSIYPEPTDAVKVPSDLLGKEVKHTVYGVGKVIAVEGGVIVVHFDQVGVKKMGYEVCVQRGLLEFI